MEVRTGKTFTALMAAQKYGAKKVIFLTVKKAISGIQKDVDLFGILDVDLLSIDSAHKIEDGIYDFAIVDEAHGLGAFPKPNSRAKKLKTKIGNLPIIFMSGTPNPESYSQVYHQFWISYWSPFKDYINFYKWAKDFVDVKQKMRQGRLYNDYKKAKEREIKEVTKDYYISYSQKQANFKCEVKEHLLFVHLSEELEQAMTGLKKHKVLMSPTFDILADTPVKLKSKLHQMSSGHVITEEGDYIQLDTFKADFIKEYFEGQKIAIYYKFKTELEMLKDVFGDTLTEDLTEFNHTFKNIAYQIKSGSMGVNLSNADCQVFMNIDFSSKDYIQSKARLQTQARTSVDVYFVFSREGIEMEIYKALQGKRELTSNYFKEKYF